METASHISVIVPVLNERVNLPKLIDQFRHFSFHQVIFVDAGSEDGSWEFLQKTTAEISTIEAIQSTAGRAKQMNAGANVATGQYLLFLHADTELPQHAQALIQKLLSERRWGRFDVQFVEPSLRLSIIAWFINWRSRITGIATGDQAFFMHRQVFSQLGGFADIALMEDVELSKRLLKVGKPACCKAKVTTSGRRWLKNGVLKTVLLMWRLRLAYFMGSDPNDLAKQYRQIR